MTTRQSQAPGSPPLADSQASTTATQLETQLSTLPPVSRAPGVALVLGESQPTQQQQQQQQWSVPGLGRLGLAPTPTRPAGGDDSQGSADGGPAGGGPDSASIASGSKPTAANPAASSFESSLQSASRWVRTRDERRFRRAPQPVADLRRLNRLCAGPGAAAQGKSLVRSLQSAR
jgi:hypothetical protein